MSKYALSKYPSGIIAGAVFGIMALFMCLNTVWTNDSVGYTYFSPVFDESSTQPIYTFGDVLHSQADHYMTTNGRFTVHVVVQSFCALLGKTAFAFANGAAWFLLIILALRFAPKGSAIKTWTASALLWIIFSPLPMDPVYQINYIWVSAAICGWILIFFSKISRTSSFGVIFMLCLYSLICGSLHEGFSIPVSLAICCVALTRKFRKNFAPCQYAMGVAFGIGTLIVTFAPGVFVRLSILDNSTDSIIKLSILTDFIESGYPIWGPLLLIIVYSFILSKSHDLKFNLNARYLLLIVSAIGSFIICFAVGYFGRAAIPCGLFLSLIVISFMDKGKVRIWLPALMLIIAAALTYFKVKAQTDLNRMALHVTEEYQKSKDGIVYEPTDRMLRNLKEACFYQWTYVKRERLSDPDKPYITIRPEMMRDPVFEKDTNMLIRLAPQAWLLYQSKSHPARFIVDKTLLPGVLDKQLASRIINFSQGDDFLFDTIATRQVVIYQNERPFIRSSVRMEVPDNE